MKITKNTWKTILKVIIAIATTIAGVLGVNTVNPNL